MKAIKYIFSALVGMIALASCDSNITDFEPQGYLGAPKTIDASAVTSEALPGAIRLNWTVPADSSYSYMKNSYVNPANNETVSKVVSVYTNTLLIENTLKKYGDYTFTFQAFNAKNEGGTPVLVKAQSGVLPATISYTKGDKINVTADMLSTDNQEPTEGPIKNLVDGNYNSFFHTRWSSPQVPLPQYIQVDFKEAHQIIMFWYRNRSGSQVGPENLDIQISNDGETWESAKEILSGLPSGSGAEYTSDGIDAGKSFTHLRLVVTKTFGDKKYFNLAELAIYDANKQVYDPENE